MTTGLANVRRRLAANGMRDKPFELHASDPLPEVIDDGSEASWALWREATNAPSDWESDTVPMNLKPE